MTGRFTWTLAAVGLCGLFWQTARADTEGGRKLVEAARNNDLDGVKQLLADGVDINAQGRFQITAVWQAASKGHQDLLRFLLENGADVNVPDAIWHVTPLMFASDADTVALLIKHDAKGVDGKLNQAALMGDEKLVRAIIEARPVEPLFLAQAKAHAEIGKHETIAKLLQEASDAPLPELPTVSESTLQRYAGQYMSDRLNELEIAVGDGTLLVREEDGTGVPLVVIDQLTFALGATRFRFEVQDDRVVAMEREDLFSGRRYRPKGEVLVEADTDGRAPAIIERDEPRVMVRDRWPSFRGMEARGIAVDQNLPDEWDMESGRHIQWRTPIPGLAHSCPIVWDDKVFITTAISQSGNDDLRIGLYGSIDAVDDSSQHRWQLLCLDKKTGEVLWERTAYEGIPPVKRHLKSTQANSTPATDGRHVVALFNSGGLYCYDFEGRLIWEKQLGVLDSGAFHDREYQWGFGSSPILYRDMVFVQCDLQEGSYIAAFDINSGNELWKQPRDEISSWGTPTVYESPYGPLLLTSATNFARAYDALSGRERWRLGGNAAATIPTPLVAYDLVFITSGYRPIQPIFAVRLDAQGDITLEPDQQSNAGVAWSLPRGGPYLPTPMVYEGYFYTCGNNGILTCYEAKTGKQVYRERVARGSAASFTASPVAADGRIYLIAESGDVLVFRAGPKFELLAENSLGENCLSTPAIAGGSLLVRTHRHLISIGR